MMQPGDQAVLAFVIAVFVIFSAVMAYATWIDGAERRNIDTNDDKK
jgi:hypothetical protein